MKRQVFVAATLSLAVTVALIIYFLLLPYLYAVSENNNFERMRKKSLLECSQLPLHCLIKKGDEVGIKAYVRAKSNLELKDGWGQSALLWAVRNKKIEHINLLLESGANPNDIDERGERVLLVAILQGFTKVADQLLIYGADINALMGEDNKQRILHYCVIKNKEDCVVYLIEHGVDTTLKDGFGYSVIERLENNVSISEKIKSLVSNSARNNVI